MNILIAGLTGAGKTAYSQELAIQLGLRYISGSRKREEILNRPNPENRRSYWLLSEEARFLDESRIHEPNVDLYINEDLRQLVERDQGAVFDVWFVPWLRPRNCLSIFLEFPLAVRARRVYSALSDGHYNYDAILTSVAEKDERARQFALKAYGVDIFADYDVFDVVLSSGEEVDVEVLKHGLRTLVGNVIGHGLPLHSIETLQAFSKLLKKCCADQPRVP